MIQDQKQRDNPLEDTVPGTDPILIIFPSAVRTFPTRAVALEPKI